MWIHRPRPRFERTVVLAALLCAGACCPAVPVTPMPSGGCTPSAAAVATAQTDAGHGDGAPAHPDAAARAELFAELVAKVRRFHVFAPAAFANLGRPWEEDLPRLRQEFASAGTPSKLLAALRHFGHSLRDPHCGFRPAERSGRLHAGFSLAVEYKRDHPSFYVFAISDPERAGALSVGDVLISVDGVTDLTGHFALEAHANSPFTVAATIARYLPHRPAFDLWAEEGKSSTWVFQRRGSADRLTLRPTWQQSESRPAGPSRRDWDPGARYGERHCAQLRAPAYGPYELSHRGWGVCVYTAKKLPHAAYPIVRQFTFMYTFPSGPYDPTYLLEKDHGLLQKVMSGSPRIRGVILDVRDNHGGNNPNWYLDWWAPSSYVDHFVRYRVHEDLVEEGRDRPRFIRHPDIAADYRAVLEQGGTGERYTKPWPFFCPAKTCQWENRYEPSNSITTAPVALLVGPKCMSSCDSFAKTFSEYRFGPVIGSPTAAAYTTARYSLPVVWGERELGELTIAVSYEVSGKTRQPVEAVPIRLDQLVPRTFDNFARHDALLVEAAIAALRRTPPRGTP